jgi:hypothetical protein
VTDAQLYLAIGLPVVTLTLGMIGNGFLFNALSARMGSMENRMLALETRVENRLLSIETKMDLLIGKIADIDTRLSVLEDRSKR